MEEKAAIAQLRQFCQTCWRIWSNNEIFRQWKAPVAPVPRAGTWRVIASPVFSPPLAEQPSRRAGRRAGSVWLNELIWRGLHGHLIAMAPRCVNIVHLLPGRIVYSGKATPTSTGLQEGKMGYPIVDAAMRQLNSTGWMHNRLRMITASFLAKDSIDRLAPGQARFHVGAD
ncbi:FAD-binding domain-containing protein [Shigella flexneri]